MNVPCTDAPAMVRLHWLRSATALAAMTLSLSGCATGQLQVGRASTMVTAGRTATDASRKVVADTFESHRRFVTELAAIDPNCDLPYPRLAISRNSWGNCGTDRNPATTVSGPSRAYATLTLASIDGAVAYLDAIDAIATRKPIDIAASLESARGDLSDAIDAVNALANSKFALPISQDQLAAGKTLLDLLSGLISVSHQVRDLKRVEVKLDAGEFNTSIAGLKAVTRIWTDALTQSVTNEESQVDGVRLLQQRAFAAAIAKSCPPKSAVDCPFSAVSATDRLEYRAYAEHKLALIDRREQVVKLAGRLDALLDRFATAHREYRELLFDPQNAKLSAEERKQRAQIIRGQILSAIKGVLAVVALF